MSKIRPFNEINLVALADHDLIDACVPTMKVRALALSTGQSECKLKFGALGSNELAACTYLPEGI